jgi:hypothetical protein
LIPVLPSCAPASKVTGDFDPASYPLDATPEPAVTELPDWFAFSRISTTWKQTLAI